MKTRKVIPCDKYVEGCDHPQCNEPTPRSAASHTPTPLNVNHQMGRPVICKDRKVLCTFDGDMKDLAQREIDAAFIVRAVNSFDELTVENIRLRHAHEELVDALSQLLDRLDYHGTIDQIREEGPIEDARNAIAKATGGK